MTGFHTHGGLGDALMPTPIPVQYCNIAGVGLTACPGQNLQEIQCANQQAEDNANIAYATALCKQAAQLNGTPDNCAAEHPLENLDCGITGPAVPTQTATGPYAPAPAASASPDITSSGAIGTRTTSSIAPPPTPPNVGSSLTTPSNSSGSSSSESSSNTGFTSPTGTTDTGFPAWGILAIAAGVALVFVGMSH